MLKDRGSQTYRRHLLPNLSIYNEDAQMAEWGVAHARECGWWDGYTFSKAIAEMLVQDIQDRTPFAILGRKKFLLLTKIVKACSNVACPNYITI